MPTWHYFERPTNTACHDLTTHTKPPPNFQSLLGLGLNFCPRPRFTTFELSDCLERLRGNLYNAYFFANKPSNAAYDPKYHIRSGYVPPPHLIDIDLRCRFFAFKRRLIANFKKRKSRSNLLPNQRRLLAFLQNDERFIVGISDKNLGPCIIERDRYVSLAFRDHLSDKSTYTNLAADKAHDALMAIRHDVRRLLEGAKEFTVAQRAYIVSFLDAPAPQNYPQFYLTFKIHKVPLKTRPIVSVSGSVLHGLGVWLDAQLQPLVKKLDSYISSSFQLLTDLLPLPPFGTNARVFTADAVSMYTNIDTDHATEVIGDFLKTHPFCEGVPWKLIMEALRIIMTMNVFQFSDQFFIQTCGTAMGSPPAPSYANLYYGIKELSLQRFQRRCPYRKRYIDDVFGIWLLDDDPVADAAAWLDLQSEMNNFGKLRWTFSERTHSTPFLDLQLTLDEAGKISSRIYEKALNLYLYLPPASAHPPGVLKGIIFGSIYRIYRLTSEDKDRVSMVQQFFSRLRRRGYQAEFIKPIFQEGLRRYGSRDFYACTAAPSTAMTDMLHTDHDALTTTTEEKQDTLFLHLPFHPQNPPSSWLQRTFQECIYQPGPKEKPLEELVNNEGGKMPIKKMLVAYHRPKNLRNLLSPRKFDRTEGPPVSTYRK